MLSPEPPRLGAVAIRRIWRFPQRPRQRIVAQSPQHSRRQDTEPLEHYDKPSATLGLGKGFHCSNHYETQSGHR